MKLLIVDELQTLKFEFVAERLALWNRGSHALSPVLELASDPAGLDRSIMPVLLRESDCGAWLDGSAGPEVLQPAAESALREWTVDRRVNRRGEGDDDPTIVEPLAALE